MYLNLEQVNLYHVRNYNKNNLIAISAIWPDVVIVDGYFSKDFDEECFKNIAHNHSSSIIFCLTPFTKPFKKQAYNSNCIYISEFHKECLVQINNSIRPILNMETQNV
jgi:spore coat polysaccharide biosynthesis predicted glycosyltransferase SpsG